MKRFTETEIWRDPWFQKLDLPSRTLWAWLRDRVDNAGVIDICWPICNAETGMNFSEESMKAFGDRVERLENGKYFLPKFIRFQFGELTENPLNKVHQSIIKLLKSHSLYHRVLGTIPHSTKDKDKDKDKVKDKDSEKRSKLPKSGILAQRMARAQYEETHGNEDFKAFWELYPNKVARGDAIAAWNKINPSAETVRKIMEAVRAHSESVSWKSEGGKFIPSPSKWLLGLRWEDKIKDFTKQQIHLRPAPTP